MMHFVKNNMVIFIGIENKLIKVGLFDDDTLKIYKPFEYTSGKRLTRDDRHECFKRIFGNIAVERE
jgi:hypothetical protein